LIVGTELTVLSRGIIGDKLYAFDGMGAGHRNREKDQGTGLTVLSPAQPTTLFSPDMWKIGRLISIVIETERATSPPEPWLVTPSPAAGPATPPRDPDDPVY
jgi:hypothetical protein